MPDNPHAHPGTEKNHPSVLLSVPNGEMLFITSQRIIYNPFLFYNIIIMTDPTNTYEARAEMQADFELEDYMLKKKIFEYMDEYSYVNKSEVEMSAQEAWAKTFYPDEPDYQMSYGEIADAQEYAEMYIKEKNIKFDE